MNFTEGNEKNKASPPFLHAPKPSFPSETAGGLDREEGKGNGNGWKIFFPFFTDRTGRIWQNHSMKTRLTLRPGDRGTKKLAEFYGDRLVAVRYRYDPETKRRIKTAEIIVDECECPPAKEDIHPHDLLLVEVGYQEVGLREQVKQAGGRWNPDLQGWILPRHRVVQLNLQHRIMTKRPLESHNVRQYM